MSEKTAPNIRRYLLAATISLATAGICGCSDDASQGGTTTGSCNTLCTESQTCIEGSCVNNDLICGEIICNTDQTCKDSACVDNDKICGEIICKDDQTCKDNACVDNSSLCGTEVCTDSQTCKDNQCVDTAKICGESVCTDEQTCKDSACIDNSKICGDSVCTIDQTCREGECVETKKICGESLCQDDQTCLNDSCVPTDSICGDIVSCDLSTEECVDNTHCEPIDLCRHVVCEVEGQICDNGTCRDRKPCENIVCNDGQACAITELSPLGECIDELCAVQVEESEYKSEKQCEENQMCVKGECIDDGCVDKVCETGWICIKGTCEEQACIGKVCDDGRTCVAGDCIDNECLPKEEHICDEGKTCSKGDCIFDKCIDVTCPQDKVCVEDGTCQFDSNPEILLERMEDTITDENGKTTSAKISLNHTPAADVTFTCEIIPPESADEATVDCSAIVLTPENCAEPQSMTITGVADHAVDQDQNYKVKITSHSEDPEFDGLTVETEELTNTDVDKAGINAVNADDLMTNESGTTAEFSLSFTSKPAAPVTITLTSSNTAEGVITSVGGNTGNTITVDPENWDKPIAIVVTGVDDDKHDPDSTFDVTFDVKSDDANYNGFEIPAVTIKNGDNDTPTANFSKLDLVTDETPSSASFTFNLATAPTADVKASLKVTKNDDEVTLDTTEITISKADWQKDNSVTVTGVIDHIIDADEPFEITVTFTSDDKDYNFTKTITGTNKNTDTASFVLPAAGSTTVTEAGSSITLDVRLSSKPTGKVTVTPSTSDATETKITSAAITFTPDDWDQPHTVTVAGVDDHIVDGSQLSTISLAVTNSEDTNFKSLKLDAWKVTTEDNDKAGLVISKSNISVNENAGKDTFTVALAAQPENKSVSVAISSTNTSALTVSPTVLTFTSANWNTPQTVTATGVDNKIADLNGQRSSIINLVSTSEDAIHTGLKGSIAATILDDDTPAIDLVINNANLTPSATSTTVSVSLSMEPASAVTVSLSPNSTVFGLSPTSVTFDSTNWNKPKSVTVTTVAKNAVNAWTYGTITGTASSTNAYNGKSDSVNVTYKAVESITGNTSSTGSVMNCSNAVTLLPGRYKLQAWGAAGGDGVNNDQTKGSHGGLGGYAEGILTLTAKTTVYLHYGTVGFKAVYGQLSSSAVGGGCNGGGGGGQYASSVGTYGFGGGGSSDIRIGGDTPYYRVLVAGGGGGADNASGESVGAGDDGSGGYGGGASGGYGKLNGSNYTAPGTQTSGYAFGSGQPVAYNYDLGGGGGGWYGGYAPPSGNNYGGGGGSGFVYTSTSTVPSGYMLSTSMRLTNTVLRGGNESFPAITSGYETGHKGNGYVKITLLE